MKIFIINTLYEPNIIGGAERSVQILAEELVRCGNNVTVATLNPDKGILTRHINGVKVIYIGLKNIYWPYQKNKPKILRPLWHAIDSHNPLMASLIGELLLKEKPDVVHTNNIRGFTVATWKVIKKHNYPL